MILIALAGIFYFQTGHASSVCEQWFNDLKIPKNAQCELKCASTGTDMKTFACAEECEELCKQKKEPKAPSGQNYLSAYYYAYSEDERKIIKKEPMTALTAFNLSIKAESLCSELYWESLNGDESDACRHYSWAIYMQKSLGEAKAKKILDAHEAIEQPKGEKEMDTHNNHRALTAGKAMNKKSLDNAILESFKKDLKSGKLKVLRERDLNRKEL